MTLLNRIDNTIRLWEIMLPHVTKPQQHQCGLWCQFPDEIIERGIVRAARKFAADKREGTLNPEIVWRYAAGVMSREAAERKERVAGANSKESGVSCVN
jgi:hypothetical protein